MWNCKVSGVACRFKVQRKGGLKLKQKANVHAVGTDKNFFTSWGCPFKIAAEDPLPALNIRQGELLIDLSANRTHA
jgi:hypothetical protein